MPQGHRYAREELAEAVSASRSWRRVLRSLGRSVFFVVDGELNAYLLPYAAVSGYAALTLRYYRNYLVGERGNWLRRPDARRAS